MNQYRHNAQFSYLYIEHNVHRKHEPTGSGFDFHLKYILFDLI